MIRIRHIAITPFFALALLCFLVWCPSSHAETGQRSIPDGNETIVFGYTPQIFYNVDPKDAIELVDAWSRITEKKLGGKITIVSITYKTLAEAELALVNSEVDFLIMIPEDLIELRKYSDLEPVLTADFGEDFYNNLLMLVQDGSGITQIDQLRGKKLMIDMGQQGTIPMKWLESVLKTQGLPKAEEFFGSITECNKGNQALLPVFFGKADVALVGRNHFEISVELNPQIGHRLRILKRSPGFITGVLALNNNIRKKDHDKIISILKEMHTEPRGKQIMTLFRINRLIPFVPEHMASIEELIIENKDKTTISARIKE